MIKQLEEKDRGQLMNYLVEEPSINLFIISDVELFGFDEVFQQVWAEVDDLGAIVGVLLRYRINFIAYTKREGFDWRDFIKLIDAKTGEKRLSGKSSIIDEIAPLLDGYTRKDYYFCELRECLKGGTVDKVEVKIGRVEDAERFYEFIEKIDEFSGFGHRLDHYNEKIKSGSGRIYYSENENGEIMTMAQTTAENSVSAMVVGVATGKAFRGQGLMSACVTKLCKDVMAEGKSLCLFYNNPYAGRVYLNMGFETIDQWSMLTRRL